MKHYSEPVGPAPYIPEGLKRDMARWPKGPVTKDSPVEHIKLYQEYLSALPSSVPSEPWGPGRAPRLQSIAPPLTIDGVWGPKTNLRHLQYWRNNNVTPLERALQQVTGWTSKLRPDQSFSYVVGCIANNATRTFPLMEVGGPNRGPWVRTFMGGREGDPWFWCAGFVSEILRMAAAVKGMDFPPIRGSVSCDELAAQASRLGLLITGRNYNPRFGDIFLVGTPRDFTHTGIIIGGGIDTCATAEGNTNDSGSRNGDRATQRRRRTDGLWHIALSEWKPDA